MNTYQDFVEYLASKVAAYDSRYELANQVFEVVCSADEAELKEHLDSSENWKETGISGYQARKNVPDFDDPMALGDWEGFDLESVQQLCQDVLETVIDAQGGDE